MFSELFLHRLEQGRGISFAVAIARASHDCYRPSPLLIIVGIIYHVAVKIHDNRFSAMNIYK